MDRKGFRLFLRSKMPELRHTAVESRIHKAGLSERLFSTDLDAKVRDDFEFYWFLTRIKNSDYEKRGNIQNSVRKYYYYRNGHDFPRLKAFEKRYMLN